MSGWGKYADEALGEGKNLFDHAKRGAGHLVDEGAGLTGGLLDTVGAHGAAQQVRDGGDSLASYLGAHVAEQELSADAEPGDLIHGKPSTIRDKAAHLLTFAAAFDEVGAGMKAVDSTGWKGAAADTFRAKFALHPTKWLQAGVACLEAAAALNSLADTVEWAQGQAREAIRLYKQGKSASDAHQDKVDAYKLKVALGNDDPGPRPPETDPGSATMHEAQQILDAARSQRDTIAGETRTKLTAALQHAPKEPSATEQLKLDGADLLVAQYVDTGHVLSGVVKGTAGIVNFVRSVDFMDPYNLTHPAAFLQNKVQLLGGVVSQATHPERALESAWNSFKSDPFEFGGELLPQVALAAATDGAGAAAEEGMLAADGAEAAAAEEGTLAEGATESQQGAETSAADAATSNPEEYDTPNPNEKVKDDPSDPIDLTTGKMYLPQTDVTLPGALPLVFKRRVESGYRFGRWFGQSWSSTIDQRLEIDSKGVVFIQEDGMLLSYPHPAPGLPTLPSHGPRWPLDRVDGGYTISDPRTRRTWHFADHGDRLAVLEQIDDRNGNWITFDYDVHGTPLGIVSSAGYDVRITTDVGRVTALHLASAGQTLMRYSYTDGDLTEVINSSGMPLRFTYDEAGRVTSWTDTNNLSYTYTYDDQDRCTAQGGTHGHMTLRLSYDQTTQVPASV